MYRIINFTQLNTFFSFDNRKRENNVHLSSLQTKFYVANEKEKKTPNFFVYQLYNILKKYSHFPNHIQQKNFVPPCLLINTFSC